MNATNTSSIKSAKVWQATLLPSKLFAALYCAAVCISLSSLWYCPVELFIRLTLMGITLAGGIAIYQATRSTTTLSICEDGSWQMVKGPHVCTGFSASGCYRSMLLVVVAIKPEHGITEHAVVWRDSVSARDFSALHIRLALTGSSQLA